MGFFRFYPITDYAKRALWAWYGAPMLKKIIGWAAKAQMPAAVMFLAVLGYDLALRYWMGDADGLGAPVGVLELAALTAGALAFKRPSEVAKGE